MSPPTVALSLLLAPVGPPLDTWQAHEAECVRLEEGIKAAANPTEAGAGYLAAADECRRAFETVPDGRKATDRRSFFAFEAHRLYQRAHDAGNPAALCADARTLDALAAQLAAHASGARARDQADLASMREQVASQIPAPCPDDKVDAKPEHARGSPATVATSAAPPPAAAPPAAAPPPQALALPQRADLRPAPKVARRPLRIAGGAALGLGLGLGAGMIGALVRGAALHEQAAGMTYAGQLIPEGNAGQFGDLDARGHRADHAAIGLGVAGGVLAIVGVALVVVDARRGRAPRRVALGSPVLPTSGIRLTVEF